VPVCPRKPCVSRVLKDHGVKVEPYKPPRLLAHRHLWRHLSQTASWVKTKSVCGFIGGDAAARRPMDQAIYGLEPYRLRRGRSFRHGWRGIWLRPPRVGMKSIFVAMHGDWHFGRARGPFSPAEKARRNPPTGESAGPVSSRPREFAAALGAARCAPVS